MPNLLRPGAWCPMCGKDIIAISRSTTHRWGKVRVTLEFHHDLEDGIQPNDHIMKGDAKPMDLIQHRLTVNP